MRNRAERRVRYNGLALSVCGRSGSSRSGGNRGGSGLRDSLGCGLGSGLLNSWGRGFATQIGNRGIEESRNREGSGCEQPLDQSRKIKERSIHWLRSFFFLWLQDRGRIVFQRERKRKTRFVLEILSLPKTTRKKKEEEEKLAFVTITTKKSLAPRVNPPRDSPSPRTLPAEGGGTKEGIEHS